MLVIAPVCMIQNLCLSKGDEAVLGPAGGLGGSSPQLQYSGWKPL